METFHQSLVSRTFFFNHLNNCLSCRLEIGYLFSFQVPISREVLDLLHIRDKLFVEISLDLGQLLYNICVMVHNICQISHQFIYFY